MVALKGHAVSEETKSRISLTMLGDNYPRYSFYMRKVEKEYGVSFLAVVLGYAAIGYRREITAHQCSLSPSMLSRILAYFNYVILWPSSEEEEAVYTGGRVLTEHSEGMTALQKRRWKMYRFEMLRYREELRYARSKESRQQERGATS